MTGDTANRREKPFAALDAGVGILLAGSCSIGLERTAERSQVPRNGIALDAALVIIGEQPRHDRSRTKLLRRSQPCENPACISPLSDLRQVRTLARLQSFCDSVPIVRPMTTYAIMFFRQKTA